MQVKPETKTDSKCVRKSSRQSSVLLRPSKVRVRCGLRKSTREKSIRSSRYRRVMPDSSSTDDDSASADEIENMEMDQTSVDDSHEPTHGLEKEHSTDDSASESEPSKRPSVKQLNSSSVKKKRRARFVSKKARRLKEFQKRMARMSKAAEIRLHEPLTLQLETMLQLSELCPADDIRTLRDTKPNLALYTHDYSAKPKVRQSDMDMLAYNAARNDFEWEWYNDAEQLISRLVVQESSDRIEDLENDIKFARLEKYNRILKTRKAYRRAIVEHDKIPEFFRFMMNMTMEKRKASQIFEQRSQLQKLLVRAQQCLTKKEIEDLRNHIEKTNELMDRISKLQELQRSGVTTLKEAVLPMIVLLWARALMDSLPSLLFLNAIVEIYCRFAISSSLLILKKAFRCFARRHAQFRKKAVPCSLESVVTEELVVMDEVLIQGPAKHSTMKFRKKNPRIQTSSVLQSFNLKVRTFCSTGGPGSTLRHNQSSGSSSQSVSTYPVNVDAVLGANTVEDIADTHPDFARLLLDCYSAGCDLEEYKREFQRLKNLRIKRQGGVNQTLSFSLFPSVPSDLPGHLFVRLMKFHSVYEGACRKYLADVVNRRAEASSAYPYELSVIGVQDLIQGGAVDYGNMASGSISYPIQEFQFTEPGLSHGQMSSEVTYSPAVNSGHTHMRRVSHSATRAMGNQHGLTIGLDAEATYMQQDPGLILQSATQQGGGSLDRPLAATPLPTWSVQQTSVSAAELRSRMATPLPPLEIRQCPVLQPSMIHSDPRVESRTMQTPAEHLQSRLATPVSRMENRHSYNVMSDHSQQCQQMRSASAMHIASCVDSRMMSATPLIGSGDSSIQNQSSPFATPTKKPRARRKVTVASGTSSSQSQPAMTLQGRQMTATPIPGWQPHQSTKNNRQMTTTGPDHREMMSSTPLPGWGSHQVGPGGSQVERSPLVSSQLVTPVPQSCEVMNQSSYEQTSQLYPHSRDMMTPAPFAQPENVAVPYPQGQNMATASEMYSQSAIPSYQWSETSSMSVYQQGQYVQQQPYNQQSQFSQINTNNQQVAFIGSQSSQYSRHAVHQQSQYPQGSTEVQKVSAFSQPYSYVQQSYSIPSYQQQSPFSQDSYSHSNYPQRSPYAQQQQQQTEHQSQQQQQQTQPQSQQQQQNQTIQQHLNQPIQQQPQAIQRQVYENSAQYGGPFIPTYTTQTACDMQSSHHASGVIQTHQIPSCEVTQQPQQPAFPAAMLDISGSSTGTIGEIIQNREDIVPGETLDVSHGDSSFNSLTENSMVNPMLEDEIRPFGITQVPPPPRNDSEATVPARTSPNSCSPEFIGGDDETNSLIPTIFYSSNQNDMSDLRIQDSPLEKGLNCQHFRFDIILAMKHHRIGKEDYERTLQELDQMEKENVPLDAYSLGTASTNSPVAHSLLKPNILQSGDANDLGFLLSDDVIAEFDSMSKAAKHMLSSDPSKETKVSGITYKQQLTLGASQQRDENFPHPSQAAHEASSSQTLVTQKIVESHSLKGEGVLGSSAAQSSLSVGQPASPARRTAASELKVVKKTEPVDSSTLRMHSSGASSGTVENNMSCERPIARQFLSEKTEHKEESIIVGGPAVHARRSDIIANAEYEDLSPVSPVVISPEPLSDEPEWWRKDEKVPLLLSTSTTTTLSGSVPTTFSLQAVEDPRPSTRCDVQTSDDMKQAFGRIKEPFAARRSRSPEHADMKKLPQNRQDKHLFGSDSSSYESDKDDIYAHSSSTRLHHSLSSLSAGNPRRSHSPHSQHATSPRSTRKKLKKSSLLPKQVKEAVIKSGLSKVDLSRELLAKQIAEIIEEERGKLPPEEAKQLKRPLSPATLDVVIQDLMQHHISEDTSPNRELFASKLLGTDLFSKLFFRAGKCVFRHYEEMDDLSRKEKGKGSCQRRKGVGSRKRDTELLRGIRKSREIQKYRDAARAAKEPSEAEKAAAAERAKLEAMPWLARSTFKPIIQQGSSTRFVIPKKTATTGSGNKQDSRDTSAVRHRDFSRHSDTPKLRSNKGDEPSVEIQKSSQNLGKMEIFKRSRSPSDNLCDRTICRSYEERAPKPYDYKSPVNRSEEVAVSLSYTLIPKSGLQKAKAKYTWSLKRWRSAAISVEEPLESSSHHHVEEPHTVKQDIACVEIHDNAQCRVNSIAEAKIEKQPALAESSTSLTRAECASAAEAELAALALQEELSRSEQGSPDDQFDALRYLAAMPESEFHVANEDNEVLHSTSVPQRECLSSKVETSVCPPVAPKLFSPERPRYENHFEQVDWMRIEQVSQPFFVNEFETDPWRLPLSTADSLTPKHVLESPQTTVALSSASLYSSLQEELDIIVRDTLADTTYEIQANPIQKPMQPLLERFEWPKADVPIRSYALDVILPKLSCDKSRIPIIDMCCCKRCLTRCVYFCDDDEWKYLYDCAVSRRKEKESTKLVQDSLVEEFCSITPIFLRRPDRSHAETQLHVCQSVSAKLKQKIRFVEEANSVTQNLLKGSAHGRAVYS
ncbi:unnamed protein product [Strongylus vulgaris]|uniref:Transcriptional adapter 2-alpha/beta-like domain-containing protein n=1 Tax=Strongylus vulgaris TaxID=40348 RepID=A0A3P7JEE5_STRVU|nr:unnamed protein product [Strongylus vulgaris]